jgi:hypothetical protein
MCFTLLSSSVSIRASSSKIFPSDAYNILSILSSIVWSWFLSLIMLDINSFRSCSKSGCSTSTTSLKVKIHVQINKFIHCAFYIIEKYSYQCIQIPSKVGDGKHWKWSLISGLHRSVSEIWYNGSFLPMFQDNLSVPSSRDKKSMKNADST